MTNSPPPSVTPPPLGVGDNNASSSSGVAGGNRGPPLSPTSIGSNGGSDSQVLQHGRVSGGGSGGSGGGSVSSAGSSSFGSGRDYTFSHLHAQSGQVKKNFLSSYFFVFFKIIHEINDAVKLINKSSDHVR